MKNRLFYFIEDDVDYRKRLRSSIAELDNSITMNFFNDGVVMLQDLEEAETLPDIIVSDLIMPKLSGLEVLTIIRNNPRYNEIPFIILTISSLPSEQMKVTSFKNAYWIEKPLLPEDLTNLLNRLP